jgi:hypothetical protein
MRVVLITTWNQACGVATYSANLITKLREQGLNVEVFSATENYAELAKFAKLADCDLVHIQHEFGIMPDTAAFLSIVAKLRSRGIKVVITTHTEDDPFNIMLDGCADAVILHNDSRDLANRHTFSRFVKIPHGIPEISFKEDKLFYRKKYNIPEGAFVIGTCGFLVKRSISEMVNALTPFIKSHPDVYLNLVTSAHSKDADSGYAKATKDAFMTIARQNGFDDRIYVGLAFTPVDEFRERIKTLDLGFAYAPAIAKSNSGAGADLASCGIPVIANDAPHFSHLRDFITITNDQSPEGVAKLLSETYDKIKADAKVLETLSVKAKKVSETLGYSQIAKRHIALYEDLFKAKPRTNINTIPVLDKSKSLVVSIPNDLWQVLAIWPKLYNHINSGFKVSLAVQNESLTDLSIFQFVLAGIDKIYFDNVSMVRDPYLFKIVSQNISHKMAVDLEYWFRSGHTYEELFPDAGTYFNYPRFVGSFAEKQARKLGEGVDHILSLTPSMLSLLRRALSYMTPNKNLLVMASPINANLIEYAKEECKSYPGIVKYIVEDTRTRWALCKGLAKVFTAFDDSAVFSALEGHTETHNSCYFVGEHWQEMALKAMGVNADAIKIGGKGVLEEALCQNWLA